MVAVAKSENRKNLYFIFRENGEEVRVLIVRAVYASFVADHPLTKEEAEYFEKEFRAKYKPRSKFPENF